MIPTIKRPPAYKACLTFVYSMPLVIALYLKCSALNECLPYIVILGLVFLLLVNLLFWNEVLPFGRDMG